MLEIAVFVVVLDVPGGKEEETSISSEPSCEPIYTMLSALVVYRVERRLNILCTL